MPKQGKGTTVTFVSASGSIAGVCITGVTESGATVSMEDAVCMDSAQMAKIGNELLDLGASTLNLLHSPKVDLTSIRGEKGVLTITSPLEDPTSTTPESVTGNAVLTNYSVNREAKTLMNSSMEFTWNGDDSQVNVPES